MLGIPLPSAARDRFYPFLQDNDLKLPQQQEVFPFLWPLAIAEISELCCLVHGEDATSNKIVTSAFLRT